MEIDIDNSFDKDKLIVGSNTILKNIEEGDNREDDTVSFNTSFINNSSNITDNEYEVTSESDNTINNNKKED